MGDIAVKYGRFFKKDHKYIAIDVSWSCPSCVNFYLLLTHFSNNTYYKLFMQTWMKILRSWVLFLDEMLLYTRYAGYVVSPRILSLKQ